MTSARSPLVTEIRATLSAGTSYTDTSLTSGVTYYYVVTALRSGLESAYSNQGSAKAP